MRGKIPSIPDIEASVEKLLRAMATDGSNLKSALVILLGVQNERDRLLAQQRATSLCTGPRALFKSVTIVAPFAELTPAVETLRAEAVRRHPSDAKKRHSEFDAIAASLLGKAREAEEAGRKAAKEQGFHTVVIDAASVVPPATPGAHPPLTEACMEVARLAGDVHELCQERFLLSLPGGRAGAALLVQVPMAKGMDADQWLAAQQEIISGLLGEPS